MPVLGLAGIVAPYNKTGRRDQIPHEIETGAETAGICPRPDVPLTDVDEDVISRSEYFVLGVDAPADLLGIRPCTSMPARVRTDLVTVFDGALQTRPKAAYASFRCIDERRRLHFIAIEQVKRLDHFRNRVIKGVHDNGVRTVQVAGFADVPWCCRTSDHFKGSIQADVLRGSTHHDIETPGFNDPLHGTIQKCKIRSGERD